MWIWLLIVIAIAIVLLFVLAPSSRTFEHEFTVRGASIEAVYDGLSDPAKQLQWATRMVGFELPTPTSVAAVTGSKYKQFVTEHE
jgi:hypothetical protein